VGVPGPAPFETGAIALMPGFQPLSLRFR
jgi:hypothetical protein